MQQGDLRTQVLVVGGGLAGLTLSAALGRVGIETVVVDRESREVRTDPRFDGRTTAISLGSRRVLEMAGVWDHVADEAEPILDIRIADDNAPLFLHFDHQEVGDEPFGHIVDNRVLRERQQALLDRLDSVTHLAPAQVEGLDRQAGGIVAALADGRTVRADLVVGADGRTSFVRQSAGIEVVRWSYRQTALVFCMAHALPHNGLAVEHFMPSGPFAVLPMRDGADGAHRSSVVWSERTAAAPGFLALPEAAFNAELQTRVGEYLGDVRLLGERFAYPLGVQHANAYVSARLALVGEAAHAIHPIAGQGLNLGLRDIAALVEILLERARLGLDLGDGAALVLYERRRRLDNLLMLAVTDGLNRLFSNAVPPVRLARDVGLGLVGRLPPVKRFFMRQAMGTAGRLPAAISGR